MSKVENKTQSKVYKGLSSQTLIAIIMGVLEISVFALMSRLLSQQDFGYYAIIIAVVSVFQSLTEAGLGSAVIQRNDATKEYVSTALGLSVILGISFTILLLALASPLSTIMGYGDELTNSFRWMSVTLLLCSVNSVAQAMFMRTLDFMKFGLCRVMAYIISSTLGVVMAVYGYGVNAIIASVISNTVLTTFILFAVRGEFPNVRIYSHYVKDILSYGGWLTASVIVRRITTELDKFILARWLPVAQIGAYNRPAQFLTSITSKVTDIFDVVLFPILSSFNEDRAKIKDSFLKSLSLISWFGLIFTALLVLGSQIIIDIFFGAEWEWLITIFRVLSISVLFLSYTAICDCYFRSLGYVKAYFYARSATCIITLVCVCFGAQYGILGVAIGVLISRVFDSTFKLIYLSHKISVGFIDVVKSLLASTWVTTILAIVSYCIVRYASHGEYIGVFLYGVICVVLFVFAPKIFGKDFYENIYLVCRNKIMTLKTK